MEKVFLTAVVFLACIPGFAQGRVSFQTDSLHLVYYDQGLGGNLAGTAVSSDNMPAGVTLLADLYMGTSSSSLSLITSTTFSSFGKWNTVSVSLPGIPGGTTMFVVAQVRDSSFAAEQTWTPSFVWAGSPWYGASQEFTFVLGTSSLQYPPLYAKGPSLGGGMSTWPDGTHNMDFLAAGMRGAIGVGAPEPTSLAVAILGAATLILRRRRQLSKEPNKPSYL